MSLASLAGEFQEMIKTLVASDVPIPYVWTVDDYQKLGELESFYDKRIELIEGQIFHMSPMNDPHVFALIFLTNDLPRLAGNRYTVLVQAPITLNKHSQPAPDAILFHGDSSAYRRTLPKDAFLVIEVSDTTLRFDRTVKARLYAAANIPEYWIVNLNDRQIEVLKDPHSEAGYTAKTIAKKGEILRPIAAPDLAIEVDKFFP